MCNVVNTWIFCICSDKQWVSIFLSNLSTNIINNCNNYFYKTFLYSIGKNTKPCLYVMNSTFVVNKLELYHTKHSGLRHPTGHVLTYRWRKLKSLVFKSCVWSMCCWLVLSMSISFTHTVCTSHMIMLLYCSTALRR